MLYEVITTLQKVIESRTPLLTDNAAGDDRFEGNLSVVSFALRSVLCVPLNFKDETLGAVYVDNRLQAGIFTEREKNTLVITSYSIHYTKLYDARRYPRRRSRPRGRADRLGSLEVSSPPAIASATMTAITTAASAIRARGPGNRRASYNFV